jgi:hypothetical protein
MVKKVFTLTKNTREFGVVIYVSRFSNITNTHYSGCLISPRLFFFLLFFLFFFFLASYLLESRLSLGEKGEREKYMIGEEGKVSTGCR